MFPQSLFYVLVTFCPHEIISLVPVPVYAALVVYIQYVTTAHSHPSYQ